MTTSEKPRRPRNSRRSESFGVAATAHAPEVRSNTSKPKGHGEAWIADYNKYILGLRVFSENPPRLHLTFRDDAKAFDIQLIEKLFSSPLVVLSSEALDGEAVSPN